MKKRILPALLALCMVMSLLPVSVFADDAAAATLEVGDPCPDCGCPLVAAASEDATACKLNAKADGGVCAHKTITDAAADKTLPEGCFYTICRQTGCTDEGDAVMKPHTHTCDDCDCVLPACAECATGTCPCKDTDSATRDNPAHACGGSGCKYYLDETVGCTEEGKIVNSESHTAHDIPAAKVGNCAGEGAITAAQAVNCKLTTGHNRSCPNCCPVANCTKSKGHDGAHNPANTVCTNDEHCAMPATNATELKAHVGTCPAIQNVNVSAGDGKAWTTWTGTITFTEDCAHNSSGSCTEGHEGHTATKTVTVKNVSAKVEYTLPDPADYGTDKLYDIAVAEAIETALAGYNKTALTATVKANWELENKAPYYCDKCAEAMAAAAGDPTATCTLMFDCPSDEHKDDCLKACTHDANCPNTEGDATAHSVWYVVYVNGVETGNKYYTRVAAERAYKELKDANDTAIEGSLQDAIDDAEEAVKDAKEGTDAEKKAADVLLAAANKAMDAAKAKRFTVRALHCEKAGIPDSTVIDAEGVVTADPSDPSDNNTTETPTKAEEFTDMVDWAVEGVQYMLDKGWMEGMGDGTFGVTKTLKTTQVLTVLARMNGETITGSTWEEDAKAWAEKNAEFFEGIDLTVPSMARKNVVLVLWRQAGKPDSDFELEFTDIEGLEGDHLTAMKWAVENEIVLGNGDGTVSPDGDIMPGTLALLVMRADKAK